MRACRTLPRLPPAPRPDDIQAGADTLEQRAIQFTRAAWPTGKFLLHGTSDTAPCDEARRHDDAQPCEHRSRGACRRRVRPGRGMLRGWLPSALRRPRCSRAFARATSGSSRACCRAPTARLAARVVDAARPARRSCPRPSRSRWASSSARCSAARRSAAPLAGARRRLRRAPGADAAPPGGRRESRQPHRGVALRPAHRRLRRAARHGAPREPRAHERSHHGARLRPRHQRAAASRSRWTSSRAGSSSWSAGWRRRPCSRPTRGGRRSSLGGAWLATHWLLRESGVWRDRETRGGARGAAPRGLRLPPRRRPAGREGAPPVRPRRLDGRALPRACGAGSSSCAGEATRLRERPLVWSLLVVLAANAAFFAVARRRRSGGHAAARPPRHVRERRDRHEHDRVRRALVGARRRRRAGRRGAAARAGDGARPARSPQGARPAAGMPAREIRFRDVHVRVPERPGEPVLEGFDLTIPAGSLARDRRPERRRQDHARQAALPPLRPAGGRHRGRRRRPARARPRQLARARRGRVPGLHPLRAAAARQRRAGRRARRRRSARRSTTPARADLADLDTRARARLRGRHRSLGRPVAARRARARALRRAARAPASCSSTSRPRSSTCAARRRSSTASSRATRARHHDPDLAPLLDRAPRRPHLRARARPRRRARHARRADGARRALPHDVRAAGVALRRRTTRTGEALDVLA